MAKLREYFETDFPYTVKINGQIIVNNIEIETKLLCDFSGFNSFLSMYLPEMKDAFPFTKTLVKYIKYGESQFNFGFSIMLPNGWEFPATLKVKNEPDNFDVTAKFYGDTEELSFRGMSTSTRIFIYSETELSDEQVNQLKAEALSAGHKVQFRSQRHVEERSRFEMPVAFISHDSRDKDIARKIAIGLQKMRCAVWYDEFSLRAGANLRDSIEAGLKRCRKCVVILSKNFFSNGGWTKKEFDSVFVREILEETNLFLPIWYGVNKTNVYEYSPSLLNVKGLDWDALGEDAVVRQLCLSVLEH